MNFEEQTIPTLLTIANAIGSLRDEMNKRFDEINHRIDETNKRIDEANKRSDETNHRLTLLEPQMFSFNVRLERVEGMAHQVLAIAHDVKADVMFFREEMYSLITEVRGKKLEPAMIS